MKTFKNLLIIFVLVIAGSYIGGTYNTLKTQENEIERTLAEIENNLQSRFDTLSGSAESAKLSADLEKEIFTQIAKYRSGITEADSKNEMVQALSKANTGFRGILATFENYPQVKSTQLFAQLQTDVSGSENRLRIARKDFNDASNEFNNIIDVFPTNLIAMIFSFGNVELFEADQEATKRPSLTDIVDEN
ncbi:LemA family protein [bacterium]|jgi:LemA protein|nr:LemA family protein [bacterium]MBT6293315.1 LemA family protein [bacterium]